MEKTLNQLFEERASLYTQMNDLGRNARKEARGLNADEQATFDKMDADFNSLTSQIEVCNKLESRSKQVAEGGPSKGVKEPKTDEQRAYDTAWQNYLRLGKDITKEDRSLLETRGTSTQVTTTSGLGGFTVPASWYSQLTKEMKYYGPMLEAAKVLTTETGGPLNFPKYDPTTVKGAIIAQGAADVVNDMAFTNMQLNAYTYTSNIIKISYELLKDNAYDVDAEIISTVAERIGRILNEHFTTGTGTGQPFGIVTQAQLGATTATATAVTRGNIIDLVHSVDRAYRNSPNVGFMFNDATLAAIKKLSIGSADDRPLWTPGMAVGAPDTLEGYQYWVNNDMATMAAAAKFMLFGDFSKYLIRQVKDVTLESSAHRYFEERVIGYFGYARYDAALLLPNAVKYLRNT